MQLRHYILTVVVGCAAGLLLSAYSCASAQSVPHSIREDMGPINTLLFQHDRLTFRIMNVRNGVRTVNTSKDKALVPTIQLHAEEMKLRMEQGNVIRPNDPLFREVFKRRNEIKITLRNIPTGVVETETSRNPQVVLLIRAHARAVALFVRDGMLGAHSNTPLPPGYHS